MNRNGPENSLRHVLGRFPDREDSIAAAFRDSESFRTLCEDYLVCADALRRWRTSSAPPAESRRGEYQAWLSELEEEILEWLER